VLTSWNKCSISAQITLCTDAKLITINLYDFDIQSQVYYFHSKNLRWRCHFNTEIFPILEVVKCFYFIKMKKFEMGGGEETRYINCIIFLSFQIEFSLIFIPISVKKDYLGIHLSLH